MTFGTLYELSLELEKELGRDVEIVTNPPEHMRPAFRKSIDRYLAFARHGRRSQIDMPRGRRNETAHEKQQRICRQA